MISIVVAEEVCEKKCSRELESALTPKLGYPCSFHVATDNIVAFELTRLQDFHAIIVAQNKTRHDYFDTSDLLTMLKALDGCCPPMIFLTDNETQLAGQQGSGSEFYYVRCCAGNEFVLDELCAAILAAVQTNMTYLSDALPHGVISLSCFPIIMDANSVDHGLILYDDISTASPEHDEFDVLLSRLFDEHQDEESMYNCNLHEDNRWKRVYSFDSDTSMDLSLTYEGKKQCISLSSALDAHPFEELFEFPI